MVLKICILWLINRLVLANLIPSTQIVIDATSSVEASVSLSGELSLPELSSTPTTGLQEKFYSSDVSVTYDKGNSVFYSSVNFINLDSTVIQSGQRIYFSRPSSEFFSVLHLSKKPDTMTESSFPKNSQFSIYRVYLNSSAISPLSVSEELPIATTKMFISSENLQTVAPSPVISSRKDSHQASVNVSYSISSVHPSSGTKNIQESTSQFFLTSITSSSKVETRTDFLQDISTSTISSSLEDFKITEYSNTLTASSENEKLTYSNSLTAPLETLPPSSLVSPSLNDLLSSQLDHTSAYSSISSMHIFSSPPSTVSSLILLSTSVLLNTLPMQTSSSSNWSLGDTNIIQPTEISVSTISSSSVTHGSSIPTTVVPPPLNANVKEVTTTTITLELYIPFIAVNEKYTYVEVLIQKYDANVPSETYDSLTQLPPSTWVDVNYEPVDHYRRYIAKRFIDHVGSIVMFKAGRESGCEITRERICNGPLQPDSQYRFQIRAKKNWKSDVIEGPFTRVFLTFKKTDTKVDADSDDDLEADIGSLSTTVITIIAVLVSLLIIVIVFAGVILLWRKRTSATSKPDGSPGHSRRQFHHGGEEFPLLSSWRRVTNKPIPCKEFSNYFRLMSADSEYRFAEEFENLRNIGRENLCQEGLMTENLPKNRYGDIIPYDHSRVKLSYYDDEPGSDYINANYIHGYMLARAYLATQGPLECTHNDFWRMVWEQNTHIIVMLTKLNERFRVKCSKYWPDTAPTSYGDVNVKMVSELESDDWTIREFLMEDLSKASQTRLVHHFHYTSWPDHGVPKTTSEAVQFIMMVRAQVKPHHGPMVVHCSAGVGRTGTFIAIDATLHRLKEEDTVDIFGLVYHMRQDRMWMVQTEEQYIFIHRAILDFLEARELEKRNRMRDSGVEEEAEVDKSKLNKDSLTESPLPSPGTWRYSLSLPSGLPSLFIKHRNSVTRASSAGKAEDEVRRLSNPKRTSVFLSRTYSVGLASGDYGAMDKEPKDNSNSSTNHTNINDLARSKSEDGRVSKCESISLSRPSSLMNIFMSDRFRTSSFSSDGGSSKVPNSQDDISETRESMDLGSLENQPCSLNITSLHDEEDQNQSHC